MRDVERVVWMKKAALDQVLTTCGITGEAAAGAEPARYVDLPVASLVEHAIRRDEGELAWIKKKDLLALPAWEGDKIFLRLLDENIPFFSLKLRYEGETLAEAKLNGKALEVRHG